MLGEAANLIHWLQIRFVDLYCDALQDLLQGKDDTQAIPPTHHHAFHAGKGSCANAGHLTHG